MDLSERNQKNNSTGYQPSEWQILAYCFYGLVICFTCALTFGGLALRDYSQFSWWRNATSTVDQTTDVCRFRISRPRRREVVVDHDIFCNDPVKMSQFSSQRWIMVPMLEIGIHFINQSGNEVKAKFKVPKTEINSLKSGDKLDIKYSMISETNVTLRSTVGKSYGSDFLIFLIFGSVFVYLIRFSSRLFIKLMRQSND